jgi:DNA-directed RNA polymerase subunit E'
MYMITERTDEIRIPPERLGEDLEAVVCDLTQKNIEGRVLGPEGMVLITTNVAPLGDGRIVHGDGAVYQTVKYSAVVFRLDNQEVVDGTVCEIMKFGAFIRFGPLDGLLHISQVMDDHIDPDETNQRLVGKDTKRDIRVDYRVRTRVVSVSMNERNPRESKIGLTMRPPSLGRIEWLDAIRQGKKPGEKAEKTEKAEKKEAKKK